LPGHPLDGFLRLVSQLLQHASTAASSGNSSTAASSGYASKAAAEGENTLAMVCGNGGKAKAGKRGAIALGYYTAKDGWSVVVGKVGVDIEADTWYRVADGKLVKA
jgi:hypothetical protein